MSDDSPTIVKKILADSSVELTFKNQDILDILNKYVDDGTLSGQRSGRIKKMSDEILNSLRVKGEETED